MKNTNKSFFNSLAIFISLCLFLPKILFASAVWTPQIGYPKPIGAGLFQTPLISDTWNGKLGSYTITLSYDPTMLEISDISIPNNSIFAGNTFFDKTSFKSGKTTIVAFQVTNTEQSYEKNTFAVVSWKKLKKTRYQSTIAFSVDQVIESELDEIFVDSQSQVVSINTRLEQQLGFSTVSTILYNGATTLNAAGKGSGNTVTFASQTPSICTVSGSTVTAISTGTCTIAAIQAGNMEYNSILVLQDFEIKKPDSSFVYIPNYDLSTVSVYDALINALVSVIPVGQHPYGVAISRDAKKAYIADEEQISVIDATTNTIIKKIPNITGMLAVSADNTQLYALYQNSNQSLLNSIAVIDTESYKIINTISVGDNSQNIAINTIGNRVYVSNKNDSSISVIDTKNNIVIKTITGINAPGYLVSNEQKIYVVSNDNVLSAINNSNYSLIKTLDYIKNEPIHGIAINPNGSYVYISQDSGISVINTENDSIINTIPIKTNGIGVNPYGNVYAWDNTGVFFIDPKTNKLTIQLINNAEH